MPSLLPMDAEGAGPGPRLGSEPGPRLGDAEGVLDTDGPVAGWAAFAAPTEADAASTRPPASAPRRVRRSPPLFTKSPHDATADLPGAYLSFTWSGRRLAAPPGAVAWS
ncbi:hypothetical protein [Streptosporangium sp. NPDC087985]|uniref:hypothetical protein n=1 Tax=Streptosporangium sp. NPDC087985 TaxID=3366196 RepID=UPI00382F6CF3